MKKQTVISLIIAIVMFATSTLAQTAEELTERGNQRIKSATTLFDGISDLLNAKQLYFNQGHKLVQLKQFEKGIVLLGKGLAIEIDFSKAPNTKDFGLLRKADELRNQAIYKARAIAYLSLEKYDEMIDDDTWLIEHKTLDLPDVYTHRGKAYFEKKDYDKAVSDFLEAGKLNSKTSENFYLLGECYLEQDNQKSAIDGFTKAIALNPQVDYYYRERGLALAYDKQFQKALLDLNKAIRLNPNDEIAYLYRGKVYQGLLLPIKALADYKKAWKLNPNFEKAKQAIDELEKK